MVDQSRVVSKKRRTLPSLGILDQLGVYGYESIEWPIISALVTGDPVLLIGGHGAAKTYLSGKIAQALDLTFKSYDASKNLFEDVLGFPDPNAIQDGVMEYISTPISVWGTRFLLVDEISRAAPEMQSKWLEVIRNRAVMGKKIEGLQYIFSAMNPPSYLGAYPLDEALAGRYAVIAQVPSAEDLPIHLQRMIAQSVTREDAPMCRDALKANIKLPEREVSEVVWDLNTLLELSRAQINQLSESVREQLVEYVINVNSCLKISGKGIDGRRMGMMWRTITSACALWQVVHKTDEISLEDLNPLLLNLLESLLPFAATDEEPPARSLYIQVHNFALQHWGRAHLNLPIDPLQASVEYRKIAGDISEDQHRLVISYFMELLSSKNEAQKLRAMVAVTALSSVAYHPNYPIHPDSREQLIKAIKSCTTQARDVYDANLNRLIEDQMDLLKGNEECLFFNIAISYLFQKDEYIDDGLLPGTMKLIQEIHTELEEISL